MSDHQKKSLHPLIAVAAGSVIVFSLVGVAAMTGLLPNSNGEPKAEVNQQIANASENGKVSNVADASMDEVKSAEKSATVQVAQPTSTPDRKQSSTKTERKDAEQNVAQPVAQKNSTNTIAEKSEKPICHQCGTVESVRSIEQKAEKGSGVGAVAGAVIGGVIGNQIGGGNGRKLATVAGAVGGGYAGNEIEKSRNTRITYEVRVKLENGEVRTLKSESEPEWRSGDRVKLVDGRLVRND
jgi:outer membrane lipoprotein SlyB